MSDIRIDEIMKIKSSKTLGRLEAKLRAQTKERILQREGFAISKSDDVEFCVVQHYTGPTYAHDTPIMRYNHIRDIIKNWSHIQMKLKPSCEFCTLYVGINKPLYEMMSERGVKPKWWNAMIFPF